MQFRFLYFAEKCACARMYIATTIFPNTFSYNNHVKYTSIHDMILRKICNLLIPDFLTDVTIQQTMFFRIYSY